LEEEAAAILR
jgi:hypothetical protein